MIQEIAIISGKGGTGKTTLLLSMIPYFEQVVIADCDVDAPDVNILLSKRIQKENPFIGFQRPTIDPTLCNECGLCYTHCKFDAITEDITIKNGLCEGCGVCQYVCPQDAISMHDHTIGSIYQRETSYGPLIDARLIPGEESSGKLVSEVRKRSKDAAIRENSNFILIDGSPGIACNVISTITGVSKALIVTEPTVSGLHDLKRVTKLSSIFSVEISVVINKYDLSLEGTNALEQYCQEQGIPIVLKIPFDRKMVEAIADLKIPSLDKNIPFFQSQEWISFIQIIQKGETA